MRNERQSEPPHYESPFHVLELLRACTARKDLHEGSKLHAYVREHKCLRKNSYVGSTLVIMYAKCGALAKAQQVLKELPVQDVISWNTLMAEYVQKGQGEEALECFDVMLREGHCPTAVTFICVLKACGSIGAAAKGKEIHDKIVSLGMLEKDVVLGTTLVDMYAKCGALANAHRVHKQLHVRDVVSWNALIAGYVQQEQGVEALKCFDDMLCEGHSPTPVTFACVLKACGTIRAAAKGEVIHNKIVSLGMLEKQIVLGTALVDMYVKCGLLGKAHQVLEKLPNRDAICWSALIAGYAQQGLGEEVLKCFDEMLSEGHSPTAATYISVLKACGSIRAVAKGKEVHDKIVSLGMLKKDIILGNSLVDMYVNCGAPAKAHQLHSELPAHDVASWNVLIAGYAEKGQGEEALKCFDDMLQEGLSPTVVTFTFVLKTCASIGAAAKGEEIHGKIASLGMLENDIVLGTTLVDMYVKCNALAKAYLVHEELHVHDVVSWNALIAGYAQKGQGEKALKCFDNMLFEGHFPTVVTFACVLKACGTIGAVTKGEEIHDKIISLGLLEKDMMLGDFLVDMYVKCGELTKAQKVLEELPFRNVVSWSVLMSGYAQEGQEKKVLKCFDDMLHEGHSPDAVIFACILRACGSLGAADKGKEIHEMIASLGMLEKDIMLGNSLVDMYMKCGALDKAWRVLEELPICNAVSWNVLITGYVQNGQAEEALKCFEDMLCEGHSPTPGTLICALKACGSISAVVKGEEIHDMIVSLGVLEKDIVLGNSVVDMYVKCGALVKAQRVLEELPARTMVSWSALIAGYSQKGQGERALRCFDDMLDEGHSPDAVTFSCALKACGSSGAAARVEEIHNKIANLGMLQKDIVLATTLVDMYVKCGSLAKALRVHEELTIHDVVSWSGLISAFAQQGQGEEALKCFNDMLYEGHSPSTVTFISVLKACGSIGSAARGEEIHEQIVSSGMLEKDIVLGTALVDMYVKCGTLLKAHRVHEQLAVRGVVSWSVLISGYAQQGEGMEAVNCFQKMQSSGMKPDLISLTAMLNAYSHSGLLEQAETYFSEISTNYGIHRNLEHYYCMIDVLGRAGKFNKALLMIEEMPYDKCFPSWVALLAACRKWAEVDVGRLAFEHALHLDKSNSAVYILMSDIYRAAGMHEEAHKIEVRWVSNKM